MNISVMPHIWPTLALGATAASASAISGAHGEPEMMAARSDGNARSSNSPPVQHAATCAGAQ
jgi:hypothetical protein